MDVCIKNVFPPPAIEAINVIQAAAEENDRAASSDPHHGHQETDAEQETVARGFSPADSSEMSQAETAEDEKNPPSASARLGLWSTRGVKKLGAKGSTSSLLIPNLMHVGVLADFGSEDEE